LAGGRPSAAESLTTRYAELKGLPDGGACHRLDNDTGGVVLFARNRPAYETMREAFSKDRVVREYEAVVEGTLTGDGRVSWPIGPDLKSGLCHRFHEA
jgi:23S rRNA pseudouridine1911/1915/1917 synthase